MGQFSCGGGNYCGARGFLIGWKHSELPDQLTAADQSGPAVLMSPVRERPPAEMLMDNSFHTVMTNYQGLKQALHVNTGQNNLLPPAGDSHHALQALLHRLQVRLMIYPPSSCSLCKSLRALKEALSRGAFRYHLIPCNPSQKHPAGYSGCYTTTLTAATHCFTWFFVS